MDAITEKLTATPEVTQLPEPQDTKPTIRRGRGRPPGSKNKSTIVKEQRASSGTGFTDAEMEKQLNGFFTGVGMAVFKFNKYDGTLIVQQGQETSHALSEVAKQNPAVRNALEKFLTISTWGMLASAVMPMATGIAANHGLIPTEFLVEVKGVEPTIFGQASEGAGADDGIQAPAFMMG